MKLYNRFFAIVSIATVWILHGLLSFADDHVVNEPNTHTSVIAGSQEGLLKSDQNLNTNSGVNSNQSERSDTVNHDISAKDHKTNKDKGFLRSADCACGIDKKPKGFDYKHIIKDLSDIIQKEIEEYYAKNEQLYRSLSVPAKSAIKKVWAHKRKIKKCECPDKSHKHGVFEYMSVLSDESDDIVKEIELFHINRSKNYQALSEHARHGVHKIFEAKKAYKMRNKNNKK